MKTKKSVIKKIEKRLEKCKSKDEAILTLIDEVNKAILETMNAGENRRLVINIQRIDSLSNMNEVIERIIEEANSKKPVKKAKKAVKAVKKVVKKTKK